MANRVQIRRGSSKPTTSNLLNYELGWDTTNKILYINSAGIEPVSERAILTAGKALVSGDNIDTIEYGLYYSLNSDVTSTLNGTLPTSVGFKLFSYKNYSNKYDFQIAASSTAFYTRQKTNATTWGNWYDIVTSKGGTTFSDSLYIKNPNADITASSLNNETYKGLFFRDVNEAYVGYISAHQLTSGKTQLKLISRHRNTANTANVDNNLIMTSAADGTRTVTMSDPDAWCAGIGAVKIAGDTMTGNLTISKASSPNIIITASTNSPALKVLDASVNSDFGTYVSVSSNHQDHGLFSTGYYNGTTFTSDRVWMVQRTSTGDIILNGNATTATTATKLGTTTLGSTTKPIYLSSGTATECNLYAGGTAVTLNNSSKAASTASFYAPTQGGAAGKVLLGNGATSAPIWASPLNNLITVKKIDATITVPASSYYSQTGTLTESGFKPAGIVGWDTEGTTQLYVAKFYIENTNEYTLVWKNISSNAQSNIPVHIYILYIKDVT